ncbi:3-oxoacyl-reductase [Exidia glandulosa HHB12029]|uniref:3-oxoacyl-reductase n=1 Tax=Exidia glandulosa HHB12029 TaxID=1314781 RepID=A0A165EFF0_EXIGL|nr:3-oxoacyl-reductase [Exidia glandulosa HHB12029]
MQPNSLLDGRVVVVTGASRGIGRAIALASAQSGANVVVHYLGDEATTAEADELLGEITAAGKSGVKVPGDISNPETAVKIVQAAVEAYGRIDALVSNAGICPFHSFLDMPHELWKRVQAVNLDGAFYVVQAVANQMKAQTPQGGSIIAISSISALVGGGMQSHYTPTKAGVLSLMQSCAIALGPYGIRCNSLLPGTIETDINKEDLSDKKKREYMEGRIPLGRLGKPVDLAGPAVFLASNLSQYVSGSALLVDGGMYVSLQ